MASHLKRRTRRRLNSKRNKSRRFRKIRRGGTKRNYDYYDSDTNPNKKQILGEDDYDYIMRIYGNNISYDDVLQYENEESKKLVILSRILGYIVNTDPGNEDIALIRKEISRQFKIQREKRAQGNN
jgi:hypothetical protein